MKCATHAGSAVAAEWKIGGSSSDICEETAVARDQRGRCGMNEGSSVSNEQGNSSWCGNLWKLHACFNLFQLQLMLSEREEAVTGTMRLGDETKGTVLRGAAREIWH